MLRVQSQVCVARGIIIVAAWTLAVVGAQDLQPQTTTAAPHITSASTSTSPLPSPSSSPSPSTSPSTSTSPSPPPSPPPSTEGPAATTIAPDEIATTESKPAVTVASEAIANLPPTPNDRYCTPSLCEFFNGQDTLQLPHIACRNNESFGATCGTKPHLLYMSERRRQLILDMHNLARSRIASGQLEGYKPATHMPLLKWDNELEHLAGLHVRRCMFAHDKCRNTARYQYSGQNIGYFWIGREFRSHSRRMKTFIINWFREYRDANQTFIDHYRPHPDGKKIGHFTLVVADRAHRVGCSAVRFRDPSQLELSKFLMTCNYDFTNIFGEPVYQTGPTASKCVYKISDKFPDLCDWKDAVYDYDSEESVETLNEIDNNNIAL